MTHYKRYFVSHGRFDSLFYHLSHKLLKWVKQTNESNNDWLTLQHFYQTQYFVFMCLSPMTRFRDSLLFGVSKKKIWVQSMTHYKRYFVSHGRFDSLFYHMSHKLLAWSTANESNNHDWLALQHYYVTQYFVYIYMSFLTQSTVLKILCQ